jgi:tetratricopeptide (TPR) repeat protein/transcriptional regulator with XRE-family HTH domain
MGEAQGIGALLRSLRSQAGRSQSEQADVLSELAGRPVTRNEISRWENEARLLTSHWQRHYAASFSVPTASLRRAVAVSKAKRRQDGHEEGDDVQRRAFIGVMAGLAVSAPTVLSASSGQRIGPAEIAQLDRRTARLRRLDDYLGGADTHALYAAEVAATTALAQRATCMSSTRRALTSLIAEQAQLAGWAAFDAGMQPQAKRHYMTSFEAAKEASNAALAGNALAFLAYQQISTAKPSVAMATASYATAEKDATPRVRALLLERMAWTHAVAGQANETERALNAARNALRSVDDRPEPDWVFWVDDNELDIMAGRCWTELRRPLRAVPTLEAVLGRYEDTHARDKALYLTWLAHAYIDAGEVEQAATTTTRAIALSAGIGSVRPAARISKVAQRLKPHRTVPSVAQTLELVQQL